MRQKPRILPYSCSCIWGTDFYGLWWFISGSTIYDVVVLAAAFILPSYWPSDSRKLSFLNRVWECIGAPRAYFFIPTSFLYSSDLSCFWAIPGGFAVSWPSVWTGQAIIIQDQTGKRKGPWSNFSQKVLASGALLPLFLLHLENQQSVFLWTFLLDFASMLVTQSCPTVATLWTVACQAPLSMGFSRQEYWSGLPFPSPRFCI